MRVLLLRWRLLIAGTLLLASLTAGAHQQKESITRVLFNPRTGNVEVMHRFLVHDAEHAVKAIFGPDADILGSETSRRRFAEYVHERFLMKDQDGVSLPLTPVGYEIEGRFLWVYAEAPVPDDLTALTLVHDALRDLWADQVNLVNVDRDGKTMSALFAGAGREVEIQLHPVPE